MGSIRTHDEEYASSKKQSMAGHMLSTTHVSMPGTLEFEPLLLTSPQGSLLDRHPSRASLQLEQDGGETVGSILHEAKKLVSLSSGLVVTALSSFLVPMVQLSYVGHIGKYELSVAVLAASLSNATGFSLVSGALGALETLVSNAHGAGAHAQKGIILQRSLILTMLLCTTVVLLVWTQMERLMVTFGQDAGLSKDASWFLMLNAPSLFFMASSETLKRYFVCQSLVIPPTVAALCSVVVTVGFNHVFLRLMGLGLKGAALAANLSQLSPLVILIVWLSMREKRLHRMDSMEATWFGFSMEALYGWKEYILLAIPSAAMVALEWSIFEICLFMSGWLEDPELHVAIMGLSLNVSGTLYMLPSGIAFAGATRVGNAIGAKLAYHARRSAWTCVGLTTICQLLIGSLVVLGRDHVASIFTNDDQVLQGTAQIMPLVCWCMFGDGLNASVGGAFRGLGKQKLGAIFNLVAYWILGLPLAYSLAFKADLGLVGLWIGLSTCAMLNGLVMVSALRFKIDWKECVESATSRLANDPTVD